MMGWYDGGPGWAGWVVMVVMLLVFWALLIFGGLVVYRSVHGDGHRSAAARDDAERLLDERLARGEIDPEDYERRRALLRAGR